MLSVVFRNYADFFYIFPFSQLIHTAAGFMMLLKFFLYLQHKNILLLLNLTSIFFFTFLFVLQEFRTTCWNSSWLQETYGNTKCQVSICISKNIFLAIILFSSEEIFFSFSLEIAFYVLIH